MQLKNLGNSINAINDIQNIISSSKGMNAGNNIIHALQDATKGYSTEVLKLAIAQTTLDKTQIKAILSAKGLKGKILETTTAELAQTTATNTLSASEEKATGTTGGLSTAFKGLASSLGISTAALGTLVAGIAAVGVAAIAISKYKQYLEEIRQATEEAANAYKESSSSIDDYVSKYTELREALIKAKGNEEETYNIKKQLLELQTELNDKFGDEYGQLNLVTDAYKDQTDALKAYNQEVAKTYLNENQKGIKNATKEMTAERQYNLGSVLNLDSNDKWMSLREVALQYTDKGINLASDQNGTLYVQLTADAESAYEIINEFESDLREKAKELGDEHLFDNILDISSSQLNRAKETIDKYGEIYKQALMANMVSDDGKSETYNKALDAVEKYNEAVLKSEDPFTDEKVKNARQSLKDVQDEISGDDSWEKYGAIVEEVFEQVDTKLIDFNEKLQNDSGLQELASDLKDLDNVDLKSLNPGENTSFDKLKESADEYGLSVDELIDSLVRLSYVQGEIQNSALTDTIETEISITPTLSTSVEQIARQLEPQFAKLGEAYKEIFTADGFTLDNVDNSMLEDLRKSFAEIEEEVGVAFDASVLNPFFDTLTNKASTVGQVQDAFNELATAYFYSTETLEHLTSETADAIEKQLEEMGVQNAAEVVAEVLTAKTEELIVAKEYLAQTGKELASATEEEQTAFILEQIEAGNCGEALALLQLKKILVNSTQINTATDIQQIMNLASAAGMGAEVLTQLANAKSILGTVEAGGTVSLSSYEKALSDVESAKQTMLDWKPVEVDFGNVGGGASKAGSAGKDVGDAYVDAFEEELKDLQNLRDSGVIDEKEYLDRLRALYQKYFKDKKKYAEQYAKYERQYLEGMKSLYDSALSGISKLMDSKIDSYTESKEAAIESLEAEKQAAEDAYQAQINAIDDKIDALEKEKKANQDIIDDLNDEIDKIREANDERNRQLTLQEKQIQVERMQHQRTTLQYSEDKGMHYVQDTEGIRKAKNELSDAEDEIKIANIEKQIKVYEDLNDKIDDTIDNLNEQKDAIQDMIDASNKYYDTLIKEQEQYWDSMIKNMEKQKSKWEELAEIEEIAKAYSAIEQVFGDMGYTVQDILNGNEQAFEDFKSKYISLINDMNNNSSFAEGLSYATGVAEENLGSFLDKTKETADGISDLSTKGSELSTIAEGMGDLADSATTANTNTGELATSMGELNTNTEGLSDNLTSINDALTGLPEAENINAISDAFTNMGEAIKSVADALGVGEEGTVGGLVGALQALSGLSLGEEETGIVSQFQALKTAVEDVTSAISGGGSSGSSSGGDVSNSSSQSMSSGAGGEGTSGLVGAIESFKSATDEALGSGGEEGEGSEGEGSGAIGQFGQLKTAVDDVTTAIGSGDSEGGEGGSGGEEDAANLIGAINNLGKTTEEILAGGGESDGESGGVIGRFEEFKDVIGEANEHVTGISEGLAAIDGQEVECTIKVNIETTGGLPAGLAHSTGTALDTMKLESAEYNAKYLGNAHVEGTALATGNWAVQSDEQSALVGEEGFEIIVRNGRFFTVGNTGAEMFPIKKGDIVFNHEQSVNLLKNGHISGRGKAYADGTVGGGKILTDNGEILRPLQPGDKMYDMVQKFDAYFKSINGNIEKLVPNSYYEHNRQMENMVKQVTNINNISNSNKPSVNIGDIHVTCPGVTSQQVAEQLGGVIGKELDKQFSGFHNYVDQQSRIR